MAVQDVLTETRKQREARQARERRAADPEKYREISRLAAAKAYAKNPDYFRARTQAARLRDPEKVRACVKASRAKRPDVVRDYLAGYYERNKACIKSRVRAREVALGDALKPLNAAKAMRRVARKKQATPAWADSAAIASFYALAARLTAETGVPHEVDHKVPLQSRLVCGLHVEHNLQVLTAEQNKVKGNRDWPERPMRAALAADQQ